MSLFKPFSKIQIWIMGVLFFVFGTAHLKALANVENLWSARIPISLEGTIRPIEIIREQTSVGGRITAITVEENDEVQKINYFFRSRTILKNSNWNSLNSNKNKSK